ncbi:hypothetical protein TWF506_006766 [Arthrobotrys conoides]|uniref:NB-ARC domain-containing protein n=1 Tax=Arthrobotrys conoides TaxID=74498 RepID=A0AAN8NUB2_9PEZI
MIVLWITASSKETMIKGFEQYAGQICGEGHDLSQPVSIIHQFLSKKFSGRWVLILDGLDDTDIDIDQYTFNGLQDAKILVTTRYAQVANHIGATHILQVTSLNQNKSQLLRSQYINPISTDGDPVQENELAQEEINARAQLVHELGGLPLAISIIGAALRDRTGASSMSCRAYLKWPAEVQDAFMTQDPEFSNYPHSVRKAFTFAFERILFGTENHQHVSSMAFFIASCESARNTAEYFKLYRQLPQNLGLENLDFLKDGFFELAIRKLAATNIVTWSWVSDKAPSIEMHSLVRGWIRSIDSDRIHSFTTSKLRLVGFHIYDRILTNRVRDGRLAPLLREIHNLGAHNSITAQKHWDDMPDIALAFLLASLGSLKSSLSWLPVGAAEVRRFSKFSEELQLEINSSSHFHLEDTDWKLFGKFVSQLGSNAGSTVEPRRLTPGQEELPKTDPSTLGLSDIFEMPVFQLFAPKDRSWEELGHTSLIQGIMTTTTVEVGRSIETHLEFDAVNEAHQTISEVSDSAISEWIRSWPFDILEITCRSFRGVIMEYCGGENEVELKEKRLAMASSWDPRNAFFVALDQAINKGVDDYLKSSPAAHILTVQQSEPGGPSDPITEEQRLPTLLERLGDYITKSVTNNISKELIKSAKAGFVKAFERICSENTANALADEVFSTSEIKNIFLEWGSRTYFDTFDNKPESSNDSGELACIQLMDEAQEKILGAMKMIYGNQDFSVDRDTKVLVRQALDLTAKCHAAVHNTIEVVNPEIYGLSNVNLEVYYTRMRAQIDYVSSWVRLRRSYDIIRASIGTGHRSKILKTNISRRKKREILEARERFEIEFKQRREEYLQRGQENRRRLDEDIKRREENIGRQRKKTIAMLRKALKHQWGVANRHKGDVILWRLKKVEGHTNDDRKKKKKKKRVRSKV